MDGGHAVPLTDLSLLRQRALDVLNDFEDAGSVFRFVIIDEYQDINTVQEKIFFKLAAGHKNLCVVGDDDHALYRFRGATVENFVEFPKRCQTHLGQTLTKIPWEHTEIAVAMADVLAGDARPKKFKPRSSFE